MQREIACTETKNAYLEVEMKRAKACWLVSSVLSSVSVLLLCSLFSFLCFSCFFFLVFCPCSSLLQFVFLCSLSLIPPGLPLFYLIFYLVSVSCSSSPPLSFPSLSVVLSLSFFLPLCSTSSGFYSQKMQAFSFAGTD